MEHTGSGHRPGGTPSTGRRVIELAARQVSAIIAASHQDLAGWQQGRRMGASRRSQGAGTAPGSEVVIV